MLIISLFFSVRPFPDRKQITYRVGKKLRFREILRNIKFFRMAFPVQDRKFHSQTGNAILRPEMPLKKLKISYNLSLKYAQFPIPSIPSITYIFRAN